MLHRLHQALRRPALARHTPPYVPHLTVGLYGARWSAHAVQAALARHGEQVPLDIERPEPTAADDVAADDVDVD